MSYIKKYGSPLTIAGAILFLRGLIYIVFEHWGFEVSEGWGLFIMGMFWG